MAKEKTTGTEGESEGPELVRKLSPKSIIGGRFLPPSKETVLYTVIGTTHGIKSGTGDNGPYVAFLGAFEATRISKYDSEKRDFVPDPERKTFQAGQCFVPKAVEDLLAATVLKMKEDRQGTAIEFAIQVGVKPSDTAIGYEYTIKNLVKTSGADPLAALRSRVAGMLPAPAK
jgi:hypothetical protein